MMASNTRREAGVWNVARPQARNVVRSRWMACYFAFFLLAAEGLLRFTGGDPKTLLSLSNVIVFVVPLVTLVYGTIYLYNSREFIELLLAQPLKRWTLFAGLYTGLALPLMAALVAGTLIPFAFRGIPAGHGVAMATMLIGATALTASFTGVAFLIALRFDDRLTGLGAALGVWLLTALVYDGILLFVVSVLADHSLEKTLLVAALANPIDLVRIALVLQFDISALLGYTGAVFSRFFSGSTGIAVIAVALAGWIIAPLALGFNAFRRKDF